MNTFDNPLPKEEKAWLDASLAIDERIAHLIGVMTLEEKIGQLLQIQHASLEESDETRLTRLQRGLAGSCILAGSAWAGDGVESALSPKETNAVQRLVVDKSRLGIPLIFGRDVIHGHNTVFPIPLAQAASFDPALIEAGSRCIAREARAEGVHWAFAPMVDLCRDPRWGRIIEGFGEDPYLISLCGEAVVRGYQGEDPASPESMLACAKHFLGYGGSEGGRDYDNCEWTDDSLRNYVLKPFAAVTRAGVATMMSSFNTIGGTPATASRQWMRKWLKDEISFDGCVVSDWGAVTDLIEHGVANDGLDAAELSLKAGIDMEMILDLYETAIPELLESQRIDLSLIDDAVRRVLRIKFQAGLFENPYTDEQAHALVRRRSDHVAAALKSAEEGMVLLKNEADLLPLNTEDPDMTIAVLGPFADAKAQHLGSWCLDGKPEEVTSILEGLQALSPKSRITTAESAFTDEMLVTAAQADVIVVCVGESPCRTGEAHSIAELTLPPGQDALIEALGRLEKPLVVVQCSGRPLPSEAVTNYADAWLLAWHGGTEAGTAIANILTGNSAPSGRLPMTMPRNSGQIPLYYNRKVPGKLRQMKHYRAYQDSPVHPRYPFGYGLSYTEFEYSTTHVRLLDDSSANPHVEVRADVKNVGSRSGTAVAQCYVCDSRAASARPRKELKGFVRIDLDPGEKQEVKFRLEAAHLGYFGTDSHWRIDPGEFKVTIGADSEATLDQSFVLQ